MFGQSMFPGSFSRLYMRSDVGARYSSCTCMLVVTLLECHCVCFVLCLCLQVFLLFRQIVRHGGCLGLGLAAMGTANLGNLIWKTLFENCCCICRL